MLSQGKQRLCGIIALFSIHLQASISTISAYGKVKRDGFSVKDMLDYLLIFCTQYGCCANCNSSESLEQLPSHNRLRAHHTTAFSSHIKNFLVMW